MIFVVKSSDVVSTLKLKNWNFHVVFLFTFERFVNKLRKAMLTCYKIFAERLGL